MNNQNKERSNIGTILFGALVPLSIILGGYYHLSLALIMVIAVVAGLLCASSTLWAFANKNSTGAEWWQDDDASGWRGY